MKTHDELHTERTHAAYAIVGHAEMLLKVHDWKMTITQLEWEGLREALCRYDAADKAMEAYWRGCEATVVRHCEDSGELCGKQCAPGHSLCPDHLSEVGQ